MAFVFLNHYLDLHEAIEEHDPDMLDDADLTGTDFPREIPLPERPHLSARDHEKVKEWVLAVSMDRKVQPSLPKDDRGTFEGSLVSAQTGETAPACIVTGYPVLGGAAARMEFAKGGLVAVKDEWNKLVMLGKTVSDTEVQDLMRFVGKWSGIGGTTPGFSFK
jgi:intraflagellar transport protein 172